MRRHPEWHLARPAEKKPQRFKEGDEFEDQCDPADPPRIFTLLCTSGTTMDGPGASRDLYVVWVLTDGRYKTRLSEYQIYTRYRQIPTHG